MLGETQGRMLACGKAEDGRAPQLVRCGSGEYTRVSGNGEGEEPELPERTGENRA